MAVRNEKGSVSIEAENIMPVIKRWLYSDKDIFLREAVSNACDAITKFRMLHPDSGEDMKVTVAVDKEKKIIRISDTGIGMTEEEVRKYINQVAFSGASEFMKQFEEKPEEKGDIIGHFGLGFYSVFMVSEKVEIETLSSEEGAEPVHWVSEDGMGFEISDGSRKEHGTDIILHISEEEKEYYVRQFTRKDIDTREDLKQRKAFAQKMIELNRSVGHFEEEALRRRLDKHLRISLYDTIVNRFFADGYSLPGYVKYLRSGLALKTERRYETKFLIKSILRKKA